MCPSNAAKSRTTGGSGIGALSTTCSIARTSVGFARACSPARARRSPSSPRSAMSAGSSLPYSVPSTTSPTRSPPACSDTYVANACLPPSAARSPLGERLRLLCRTSARSTRATAASVVGDAADRRHHQPRRARRESGVLTEFGGRHDRTTRLPAAGEDGVTAAANVPPSPCTTPSSAPATWRSPHS